MRSRKEYNINIRGSKEEIRDLLDILITFSKEIDSE